MNSPNVVLNLTCGETVNMNEGLDSILGAAGGLVAMPHFNSRNPTAYTVDFDAIHSVDRPTTVHIAPDNANQIDVTVS